MIAGLKETHPSPDWMESFETIQHRARVTKPLTVHRSRTSEFFGDHSSGTMFWRPDVPVNVGGIYSQPFRLSRDGQGWGLHFRVMREASWYEVKSMVGGKYTVPRGRWYEIHAD